MNRSKLDIYSEWIERSLPSIRKAELKRLKEFQPRQLATKAALMIQRSVVDEMPLTKLFTKVGGSVVNGIDLQMEKNDRRRLIEDIGHHILGVLESKEIVAFEQPREVKSSSFTEGKWTVVGGKGNYWIKGKSNKFAVEPYRLVIKDDEFIDALISEVDVAFVEEPIYIKPITYKPEPFTGFYHREAGPLVRNTNRAIRRKLDNPNHPVVKAMNKQIAIPYSINTELLEIYNKLRNHKIFTLKGSNLSPKQVKSKTTESDAIINTANAIGDKDFYTYKFLDSRNRFYSSSIFLKHDGSKLAKSIIQLANKKALGTEGMFWLKLHAANCWGEDKLNLDERVNYTEDHLDEWMVWANDPINNQGWMEADDAFGFIAAIIELKNAFLLDNPLEFNSGIMVALDASCSGLQILSALSRDEKSGAMCNLTGDVRGDYYGAIAKAAWETMKFNDADVEILNRLMAELEDKKSFIQFNKALKEFSEEELDSAFRAFWGKFDKGTARKIVKRPCMTYFYSCLPDTMAVALFKDFVSDDKFKGINPLFCKLLADKIYGLCQTEMAGPTALMNLFIELGKLDYAKGEHFSFYSPSSQFLVMHTYTTMKTKPKWFGRTHGDRFRLRVVVSDEEKIDYRKVISATSPNVVHAFDSQLVYGITVKTDYDVSCIHDSFSACPADAGKLYEDIRSVFVEIFAVDQLKALCEQKNAIHLYDEVDFGKLELTDVLDQEFFVS